METSLDTRMKENYEFRTRFYLLRRTPVIIRLDGKAFHTFTRRAQKPFDESIHAAMVATTQHLVANIQGCKCGYTQSDEISLLLTDFDTLETSAWFDYNLNKLTSISAALASTWFNHVMSTCSSPALFDSRAFNVPREEVGNYFLSRQFDWIRNSKQMLAQSMFSPKQLHGKKCPELVKMCEEKGVVWDDLPAKWRLGTFIERDGTETTWDLHYTGCQPVTKYLTFGEE